MELSRAAEARRRAEEALRAQEARFRTLANAIPQLAWTADPSGSRNWFNDRWYDYTGTSLEEVAGFGWRKLHHPDHAGRVIHGMERCFARGEPWEDTHPLRGREGTYRWFLSRALPIRGEDGGIKSWLGTNTDITEWKFAEAERERALALEQQARTEAERASRARDEVIAIVAHDLRNPMNTILTSAVLIAETLDELAESGTAAAKARLITDLKGYNDGIKTSVKSMDRLISDVLDVSRIEAGSFGIRQARVELRPLVDETLKLFEPQAHAQEICLGSVIAADLRPLSADRERLIQVLSNLLGNALKFTRAGGRISVHAVNAGTFAQISVEDTGSGIPSADLPHIFDRYWRPDRASRSGAGLGLAICKGIIDAHGGRIWVESALGRGTTIHFTVPCVGNEIPAVQ
jgi:PAS domain S-box-containing protein